MTRFEPRMSGVGSNRSTNCVTAKTFPTKKYLGEGVCYVGHY